MEQYEHQYRQAFAEAAKKPLILHGKLGNQYRLVHWMALQEGVGGKWQEVSRYKVIDRFICEPRGETKIMGFKEEK